MLTPQGEYESQPIPTKLYRAGHSGRPAVRGRAAKPHAFREGQVAMARPRASAACPSRNQA